MKAYIGGSIPVAYSRVRLGGGGWETQREKNTSPLSSRRQFLRLKRMKIKEKKMKDDIYLFLKLFHIPLVLRFHSNHFHNTVTFEGACGAAYVFLTRLWPHKRKPRGDTERKKREGKKRVYRGR